MSHLIGCLGQPNQLLVKIDSVPAEHRTMPFPESLKEMVNLVLPKYFFHKGFAICWDISVWVKSDRKNKNKKQNIASICVIYVILL